jgi:4-hydroxy-tetrahydrodipicolinate synthase
MTVAKPEILSAVPTPFARDGAVDLAGAHALFTHLAARVDGLFVGGTTGEFPAMDASERLRLLETALAAAGPDRVVAHVGDASAYQAAFLARSAHAAGAVRLAAITPYFLSASLDGVLRYYDAVCRAAGEAEVYAYVFPDVAGTDLPPRDIGLVADVGVSGVKVSGRASIRVASYVEHAPSGFAVWSGNDADLPQIAACGARGTVSGVSSVAPDAFRVLQDALVSDDAQASDSAQQHVAELVEALGPSIARLKFGLSLLGLPAGGCRMAIDPPDAEVEAVIRRLLVVQPA